jgi:hypothetical protein
MKNSRKLIYIKNINIMRNVKWCGKWKSNYSLYELVFFDFVIDFIKEKNYPHSRLLFKQKTNSFIDRLKKENYTVVVENIIIPFDGLLFLKFFLNNVFFIQKFNYVLKINDIEFFFDVIFVYDNIVFFIYKENIYILNNVCLDLFTWSDDKFIDRLLEVFKYNDFTL